MVLSRAQPGHNEPGLLPITNTAYADIERT